MFCKNLFLHDKKKKNKLWLIVAAHDTAIDLKKVTKDLGVGSGNLRQGDQDKLESLLGVKAGSVNLFSIVNDTDKAVSLIVDKRLWDDVEFVGFHPMVNTSTTSISRADMKKVIELSGHEPRIIDFGGEGGAPEESKADKKPDAKAKSKPVATPDQKPKDSKKQGKAGFDA